MHTERSTALVASDHELACAGLATMLRHDLGFDTVTAVGSFDEAIHRLGRNPEVTFATFDFALPGMQRALGLQSVRTAFPTVRIAVLSESTRREDILLALTAGAHGYVPTTLSLQQIARALSLVLEGVIFVPHSVAELPPDAPVAAPCAGGTSMQPVKVGDLTMRQRQVLHLMAAGKTNREIANALSLAEGTVRTHAYTLFRTLGVHNRLSAVIALQSSVEPDRSPVALSRTS